MSSLCVAFNKANLLKQAEVCNLQAKFKLLVHLVLLRNINEQPWIMRCRLPIPCIPELQLCIGPYLCNSLGLC